LYSIVGRLNLLGGLKHISDENYFSQYTLGDIVGGGKEGETVCMGKEKT
jgi:hypothetical protein